MQRERTAIRYRIKTPRTSVSLQQRTTAIIAIKSQSKMRRTCVSPWPDVTRTTATKFPSKTRKTCAWRNSERHIFKVVTLRKNLLTYQTVPALSHSQHQSQHQVRHLPLNSWRCLVSWWARQQKRIQSCSCLSAVPTHERKCGLTWLQQWDIKLQLKTVILSQKWWHHNKSQKRKNLQESVKHKTLRTVIRCQTN